MAKFNIETSELIDKVKVTEERVIPIYVINDGVKSKVYLDWVIVADRRLYKTKKGNYFEYILWTYEPVQGNYKHLKKVEEVKSKTDEWIWYETKRQLGW